jgi:hypothetical protein
MCAGTVQALAAVARYMAASSHSVDLCCLAQLRVAARFCMALAMHRLAASVSGTGDVVQLAAEQRGHRGLETHCTAQVL